MGSPLDTWSLSTLFWLTVLWLQWIEKVGKLIEGQAQSLFTEDTRRGKIVSWVYLALMKFVCSFVQPSGSTAVSMWYCIVVLCYGTERLCVLLAMIWASEGAVSWYRSCLPARSYVLWPSASNCSAAL